MISESCKNATHSFDFWNNRGPHLDIIVSTRCRLARNIYGISFPGHFDDSDRENINNIITTIKSSPDLNFSHFDLFDLNHYDKRFLREKNLISREMEINNDAHLIVDNNGKYSLLINDEDHIRIQVIRPGFQLEECFKEAMDVDDHINKLVPYAFHDDSGYLLTNPTKTGNGFRLSLLMHLPAVSIKKRFSSIMPELKKNNIILEGTLGGQSKTLGHMYHLYNCYPSTGNEEEIKNNINTAARDLISIEDDLRDDILRSGKLELEDRMWKSFGLLKYCKKISYSDAMDHLSFIRLGVILASIKGIDLIDINKLLVMIQLAHLQNNYNLEFNSHSDGDVYRALLIQEYLSKAG